MKKSELLFLFVLLPVDVAMILISFVLAYYLRTNIETGVVFSTGILEYIRLAVYLLPAWITIFALNDLYNTKTGKGFFNKIYKIFISNSVAILFLVLAIFFSQTLFFSRLMLLFTWALSFLLILVGRFVVGVIQNHLLKYGYGVRNMLFIGNNEITLFIANEIKNNNLLALKIIGLVNGSKAENSKIKTVGTIENLEKIISKYKVNELVLTDTNLAKEKIQRIIDICVANKVTLKFVPDIFSDYSLKTNPATIGSMQVLEINVTLLDGWGRIIKRIFDIVLTILAIIFLSPLMVLIVLIQKLSSRGPVLYGHDRVGRDGQIFKLYKFRSMYKNIEDKKKVYWTKKNDDRITPLGKILRKTNLDELPQLFQIVGGEMSIVGPRPEQPRFVNKFKKDIPEYLQRHRVKSGLTGWAQVNGLKGDTSIAERVRYDMFYIENWSFLFDVKIIIRTVWLVLHELIIGKYEYRSGS